MKISKRWVEQFTDVTLENDELIKRIGAQLGAIEEVEDWGSYYDDNIVVAEIVEAEDHPDADKLGLYTIKINENGETRNLVAGDKTLEAGNKVAYIPPGSTVPASIKDGDPFEISEREIRGHLSQGMLGSAKEILLSDDHSGVAKLDNDAPLGMSLKEAYMLDDLIIDVENKMFTHRPDLFGILGLAREIAGIQGINFTSPEWYSQQAEDVFDQPVANTLPLSVDNQVPELCPRFVAVVLDNIEIKPSPLLIQSMLTRVGLRPINNVVDATNSIMYLTAQPSHAFDYDKVKELSNSEPAIVVRTAEKGEKLSLLDGREIEMSDSVVVVASDKQALSVAGSIGGADSEVSDQTTRIVLEVANWNLYSIRRTSFAHGIFTDAVTRYNKGQAPEQCRIAANQVIAQLVQTTDATVASSLIDEFPGKSEPINITLNTDFLNTRLGSPYAPAEIAEILNRTELTSSVEGDNVTVAVPFWRTDLEVAEDLVEEVGRLVGFDNLPIELPSRRSSPNQQESRLAFKSDLRQVMASFGASEVLTYNFVSEKLLKKANQPQELIDAAYRIRNSISPELEMMRTSLLPSLLDKVNPNIRQGNREFALFELNKSHNKAETESELPIERSSLAYVYSAEDVEGAAFYKAKAALHSALVGIGDVETSVVPIDSEATNPWQSATLSLLEPKRSAAVVNSEGDVIGYVGEVLASVAARFKLAQNTSVFEVDIDALQPAQSVYQPISRFPASKQDITLEVPDEISHAEIGDMVVVALNKDDVRATLQATSIYRKSNSEPRRVSFSVEFQSTDRTLKTSEVNELISSMVQDLSAKDSRITQI